MMLRLRSSLALGLAGAVCLGAAQALFAGSTAVATTIAPTEAPMPANAGPNPNPEFRTPACTSAQDCVSVGDYLDATGNRDGVAETLQAGSWSAVQLPPPSGVATSTVEMRAVRCTATGSCVAVGLYNDQHGQQHAVIASLLGGAWTSEDAPLPSDAVGLPALVDVSCPSAGVCTAVGTYQDVNGNQDGLIEELANGSWTASTATLPPDANTAPDSGHTYLQAVSCAPGGTCVAVGGYVLTNGATEGLIEAMSNGAWSASRAPLPTNAASAGQFILLDNVSCPVGGACIATAQSYADTSGGQQGLIETESSAGWQATQAPTPQDANGNPEVHLFSLSCSDASYCVVVGDYLDATQRNQGLIVTISGASWSAQTAPLPANSNTAAPHPELYAVTCGSPTSCVASGYFEDTASRPEGLVESYVDGQWMPAAAPLPANANAQPGTDLTVVGGFGKHYWALGYYTDTQASEQGLIVAITPSLTLEDDGGAIEFNGWGHVVDANASGGAYERSDTPGDTAALRFTGRSVTWISRRGPDEGNALVTIDGRGVGTFDLYAASRGSAQFTFSGLSSRSHRIQVLATGSKDATSSGIGVVVDAFISGSTLLEETSPQIKYDTWNGLVSSRASGGTYRSSGTAGALASLTFVGDAVAWVTASGPDQGEAKVLIDGVTVALADLYSASRQWQVKYSFTGLTDGLHTITLDVLGKHRRTSSGSSVSVDAFVVA
ncbi:MAG: hypothetical protein JO257_04105 [Deltaproteobacteria bacterium]|nr:hypothetical protein [Deltaproteobacteria bacterium]